MVRSAAGILRLHFETRKLSFLSLAYPCQSNKEHRKTACAKVYAIAPNSINDMTESEMVDAALRGRSLFRGMAGMPGLLTNM